jgi:hypothetical protein
MQRWLFGLWLLAACGSPGASTAQACADFVDAGHCGPVDLSDTYDCKGFASSSCDLAPYFQCLAPHYVCVNGQFDDVAMMGISMCTDLASCR